MTDLDDVASFRAQPTPLTAGNPRVKRVRKLARRAFRAASGQFVAEGPKAVQGALSVPGCVQEVLVAARCANDFAELRAAAPSWTLVEDRAFDALGDAVHPQGILAVCARVDAPTSELLEAADRLLVLCADVRDPGNAGTVIRCADAAGAQGVILAGNSVDLYNPKTVRASVGSLFHLPVAQGAEVSSTLATVRAAGFQVLAADGAGEVDLDDAIDADLLTTPTCWLFGNEAWGLPEETAGQADHRVRIPIHGRAESLNLSTAAAVCLYASARAQR